MSEPARGTRKVSNAIRECPICGRPATAEADPFCSKRCRQVDLNRWLSGRYVIPGREPAGTEGEEEKD